MKIFIIILFGGFLAWFSWTMSVRNLQLLLRQHAAESFPHVQGVVRSSEVTTTTSSKGHVSYHPHISYRYSVEERDYAGYRYRYAGSPNDENTANEIVAAHPSGSTIEVYYDPQNPVDSVLSPHVGSKEVVLLFIFFPVNLLLFWTFIKMIRRIDSAKPQVAGGMKIITEMMVTRVRLPRYSPETLGLLAAGVVSLTCGILIATGVLHPPWDAGEWSLTVVLLGGAAAFAWLFLKIQSGQQDLVINEGARTLQLPLTYKRRAQTPVPFSEVHSVVLNKVRHSSKGGPSYTYLVTLELKNHSQQKLVDLNRKRAEEFAEWLRGRLGMTAPAVTVEADT